MEQRGPEERGTVDLPPEVGEAYDVFVNGVRQTPGSDFDQVGRSLVFRRTLAAEGKLGFWRWSSIFFGVAGSYKKNDTVDVVYTANGRRVVATLKPRAQAADASSSR